MTHRFALIRPRALRWLVCAAVFPMLWACGARRLAAPNGEPAVAVEVSVPAGPRRDMDILFVVDDSVSMAPLQAKMRAQLPTFMNVLSGLPGGLPNLHIAVISTSLGAGIFGNVTGCQPGTIGNLNGAFQHAATCTGLNAGERFIKTNPNNFTGPIADVFSCIANIGASGCGFEHQFESTRLALQRASNDQDPDNAGFLRPTAYLAIVMLTNEDDCSVDANSTLFDPNQQTLADPLGGLQSYRCNEFGHKCDQALPHGVAGLPMTLTGCTSAEDGKLVTVDGFVRFLKSLKPNPSQIMVAALAGPVAPYTVGPHTFTLGTGAMESQPWMEHSCVQQVAMGADPEYADPGIRIKQWLDAFGANAVLESICADDFQPAMFRIAEALTKAIRPQCINGQVVTLADGTPDCLGAIRTVDLARATTSRAIPSCTGTVDVVPCFRLVTDATNCPAGQRIQICWDGTCDPTRTPTETGDIDVTCSLRLPAQR